MEEKGKQDIDDDTGKPHDEVTFVVEKGSPADKVLQVLKNHQFDAEITPMKYGRLRMPR